jgi:hypothetical protein
MTLDDIKAFAGIQLVFQDMLWEAGLDDKVTVKEGLKPIK